MAVYLDVAPLVALVALKALVGAGHMNVAHGAHCVLLALRSGAARVVGGLLEVGDSSCKIRFH